MGPVAAVAHHVWKIGGATRVAVDTVRSMCRMGLGPVLPVAVVAPHEAVRRMVEEAGCALGWHLLTRRRIHRLVLAQRALLWRPVRSAVERYGDTLRVVWYDYSTYKPLVPLLRRRGIGLIEYVYFPYELLVSKRLFERLPGWLQREVESYFWAHTSRPTRRLYLKAVLRLEQRYRRGNPFESADAVLTVSEWTAMVVKHVYGGDPIPNDPAVETRVFSRYSGLGFEEREPVVVAMGRISREKRFEDLIRAAAASETRPPVKILGALSRSGRGYLEQLRRLAGRLGVRLRVRTNLPLEDLAREVGRSRLFVHPTRGEHFGIVVVEAMAAGLPVVVHRSGGPYHDITRRGRYGESFESIEDLAAKIDELLSDRGRWERLHRLGLERSRDFTLEAFAGRLREGLRRAGAL